MTEKAPTAYTLYMQDERASILAQLEGNGRGSAAKEPTFGEVQVALGHKWQRLSERQKGKYIAEAAKGRERWDSEHPAEAKVIEKQSAIVLLL